jgi:DNA-directed RNA polymerase specialized sigma24 family protein
MYTDRTSVVRLYLEVSRVESTRADRDDGAPGPGTGRIPNREEIARYLLQNRERVRAFARRKLTARARSVFDSEDVFSSVLRRVDALASAGGLRLRSESDLWGLVAAIAHNSAVNRTRTVERACLTQDSHVHEALKKPEAGSPDDQAALLVLRMMLKSEEDRRVLLLLHRGAGHRAIGSALGISESASRQRWARIRRMLAERFAKRDPDK